MNDLRYRLSDNLSLSSPPGGPCILFGPQREVLVTSPVQRAILEQIDTGQFQLSEFSRPLNGMEQSLTIRELSTLEQRKIIVPEHRYFDRETEAFWIEMGYDPAILQPQLAKCPVQVLGSNWEQVKGFQDFATRSGLSTSNDPFLSVLFVEDFYDPLILQMHVQSQMSGKPWLLCTTNRTAPLIGPLFWPEKDTACWTCLEQRLSLHSPFILDQKNPKSPPKNGASRPRIYHPMLQAWTFSLILREIVSFIYSPKKSHRSSKILEIDLKTGNHRSHLLTKRPQCPDCGAQEAFSGFPQAIQIQPAKLLPDNRGGFRTHAAEDTLQRLQNHISPLTGIAPYLKAYRPLPDSPIFNYKSGKNIALASSSPFWQDLHNRSSNGGKGSTPQQAQVGALCEAIERYSAVYHGIGYRTQNTFHDLEGAIHPNDCMLFSQKQYHNRANTSSKGLRFHNMVPQPFTPEERMEWTPLYSLVNKEFRYLPTQFCYAKFQEDPAKLFATPDSNGCAAGNTLEEAILQGFLELVERDAAAIWWYNQIPRPLLDWSSFRTPYLDQVRDFYQTHNRSLYLLDITSDLGIPVFAAISHDLRPHSSDSIIYAFGCHFDPHIAVNRAVTELNQMLPLVLEKGPKSVEKDPEWKFWLREVWLDDKKYLNPLPQQSVNIREAYPFVTPEDISNPIEHCIQICRQQNLDLLVLDLTQPDIGLPVVKVVVPGLRHFWRRTAPGRLYDVPVKMGWQEKVLQENQLNPLSIFI